ncbi:MAG: hypothetical protein J7K81_03010, partial [Methanophagales archaeon]|nr:hypothetical protein [Methanophagales archaeon]
GFILVEFPDVSAFSACSAVKFKDIETTLENSTVPIIYYLILKSLLLNYAHRPEKHGRQGTFRGL